MVRSFIFGLFLGFALFFAAALPGHAQEKLYFKNKISDVQEALLRIHMADFDDHEIAKIDLNYDGIFEFIARPKNCETTEALCDFQILAEASDGKTLIVINVIEAFDLAASNGSAFGVRDLAVFQDPLNDFASTLYRWDSKAGQYQMTEKGK